MPAAYDQIKGSNGVRYRKDKQLIKKADVPAVVLEQLNDTNIVDENGLVIVEDKGDFGKEENPNPETQAPETPTETNTPPADGEGSDEGAPSEPEAPVAATPEVTGTVQDRPLNPSQPEAAAQELANTPARAFKSKTPQSKPGMGFPRKNGKTVDVFDGETPHTHVRSVGGHIVPLSTESYRTKTDAQIEERLRELGYDVFSLEDYETAEDTNDTVDE